MPGLSCPYNCFVKRQCSMGEVGGLVARYGDVSALTQKPMLNFGPLLNVFQVRARPSLLVSEAGAEEETPGSFLHGEDTDSKYLAKKRTSLFSLGLS